MSHSTQAPVILWFRRDLRLSDHVALSEACAQNRAVIPVFLCDPLVESLGAAPKWRLGKGIEVLQSGLEAKGSRLILRRGEALSCLKDLIAQTGARSVFWSRAYDPDSQSRDEAVKSALKDQNVEARSFSGHLLFDPWAVKTKLGGFYKVYTPMWRSVKDSHIASALPTPARIPPPDVWPRSEALSDWHLDRPMQRGASIVARHAQVGEAAAQDRLGHFLEDWVADYNTNRDLPSVKGTSKLSENLALGEISPRQCWHAGLRAREEGKSGAETFLKELVWREFAYHLVHHTPHILTGNWKPAWDAFPWNTDETEERVMLWKQGRTGIPFVDAAMREMYVTGTMHNRGRMIVASYLTKHLLTDWRVGLKWFEDCLTDWDPASNAMGWQWSAGSGPDATPYFRVFNPVTQLDKFDKGHAYASRWIAEGHTAPHDDALSFFEACPKSWGLSPSAPYPSPIVPADQGRKIALNAYENRGF